MTAETILYIVIASIIALAASLFMYGYKTKYTGALKWIFGILRFLTLFGILLLLINPKFKNESYTVEKPKLPVLVDNSVSVNELSQGANVRKIIQDLKDNVALNDKFDVFYYSFGTSFNAIDSLSFSEKSTNISRALSSVNDLFKGETAPTLLISDGNQTLGSDYEFSSATFKNQVFPVILGDSIKYTDLKIEQLNTNKYAFLKNQFPVEVILVYNGTNSVSSQFLITQGNAVVYRENVVFSEKDNAKTISLTLPASAVGMQRYTAQIIPMDDEKNRINNTKQFAVEVIDQATNVLIVSKITHPDIGALKKAISSNEQRRVTIKTPSEAVNLINDHQLILLYQPDRSFKNVYSEVLKLKKNTFVITGLETDWNFLNSVQENYNKERSNESETVSGFVNMNYGTFALGNINFEDYRPLKTLFGGLNISVPHEVILEQTINGITSESPMLVTMDLNGVRDAVWDAEGLWKWRAESFLRNNSFEEFDDFTGKLVQYLASNKRRSRLEVDGETFYYNNNAMKISAQYFDQNFLFDTRASLNMTVINQENNERITFPMLLKNNYYQADLNSLEAGDYKYTISVVDEVVSRSGSFTILDFSVEQQFLNANVTKLQRVATNTGGKAYYVTETPTLIKSLIEDNSYQQIQKSEQKVVPLIDWKYLLALIVLSLSAEWFIRKYNGLI